MRMKEIANLLQFYLFQRFEIKMTSRMKQERFLMILLCKQKLVLEFQYQDNVSLFCHYEIKKS